MIQSLLQSHIAGDFAYWFVFFMGQCLWVFVCAAAAIRSQHNPLKSRSAYLELNWDIYLVRFIAEIPIFLLWRHVTLNEFVSWFGAHWTIPFSGSGGPWAIFFIGFGADALLNSGSHSSKLPDFIQKFIQERIPQVPQTKVATVEATLTTKVIPVDAAEPTIEKTKKTTTDVTAPTQDS